MEILACPLCKGDLVLNVQSKEGDEIITGTLYCEKCNEYYPIDDGIPNMLPPQLRK
ncbi:methytransferase partner Trm112 [Methanomethylovorans sp.]